MDKNCNYGDGMKINYYRCYEEILCHSSDSFATTAHAHEGVEIIYLKKGFSPTFINGLRYDISDGDLFVIFPNSVHYHKYTGMLDALVISFPTRTLPEFNGIFTNREPQNPLIKNVDPEAIRLLEDLKEYKLKYKPEAQRGILLAAVSIILDNMTFSEKQKKDSVNLGAILEYCDTYYTEDLSLETIAKEFSVSKYHVSRIFTHILKISFRDYINSLRLQCSLKFLNEDDLTITEIAYESGFATIRTFNRAFKKKFGISPHEYKKKKL